MLPVPQHGQRGGGVQQACPELGGPELEARQQLVARADVNAQRARGAGHLSKHSEGGGRRRNARLNRAGTAQRQRERLRKRASVFLTLRAALLASPSCLKSASVSIWEGCSRGRRMATLSSMQALPGALPASTARGRVATHEGPHLRAQDVNSRWQALGHDAPPKHGTVPRAAHTLCPTLT